MIIVANASSRFGALAKNILYSKEKDIFVKLVESTGSDTNDAVLFPIRIYNSFVSVPNTSILCTKDGKCFFDLKQSLADDTNRILELKAENVKSINLRQPSIGQKFNIHEITKIIELTYFANGSERSLNLFVEEMGVTTATAIDEGTQVLFERLQSLFH